MMTSEFPRRFVAADADFGDWAKVAPYYQQLLDRQVESDGDLEQWLLDWSELDAAFDEEGSARYIAMTCQTDDADREQRYLHFIEHVQPHREPIADALRKKFHELAQRFPLPTKRYEVFRRSIANALALYREENIPLMIENQKYAQEYQKINGAMMVEYQGKQLTLPQLGPYQEELDREVREETWRLAANRFLQDAAALDELYDKMVHLRDKIGRNAGFAEYRAFMFKAYERFDYTPEDCLRFHDAIEAVVVPAVRKLHDERRAKLEVDTLRPWDLSVDPEGRPPLHPFKQTDELVRGCGEIFQKVSPDLGQVFNTLNENNMLDLDSRKGKAPGGYQATYDERRMPFIFMNAVGTESDVRTLLHEGGHAFHTWACRNDPLLSYRHYPTEFAEVASMGMECLATPHFEVFYGDESNRARKRFFEGIVSFFPYMACVDAMQHWVYTNVNASVEQRKDYWISLAERFDTGVDWSGLEAQRRHSWHRKLHFFEVPFYYVEYGIAQLGALQVWLNSRKDYQQAVNLYRNGLALGGSRPLPELFEAAGLKFDFSEKTLKPLIDAVMEEIGA